jgi:chemotaxis protein methyltransferase CheR
MELTDSDFKRIRDIMYQRSGVFLKEAKKPMVVTRLRRRIIELGLDGFGAYVDLLDKAGANELEFFVNAITTNETFFYRHEKQFDHLRNVLLPEIISASPNGGNVRIWSAACSTGEEPYTIAMVCEDVFRRYPRHRYEIVGSDINSSVLAFARDAVYSPRSLIKTELEVRKRYFKPVNVQDRYPHECFELDRRVVEKVKFIRHNLLEKSSERNFNLVFLRNVMIYFDRDTKDRVVANLEQTMLRGGYLIMGLSESLGAVSERFRYTTSGVYKLV